MRSYFCSLRNGSHHGLGFGHQTQQQGAERHHLSAFRPVGVNGTDAAQRIIVVAARNFVVKLAPSHPMSEGRKIIKGGGSRPPSFQVFDPPKRLKPVRVMKSPRIEPRIHFFEYDPWVVALWPAPRPVIEPPPPPDGLIGATRLHRRLQTLKLALDDLPRQAIRLVRLQGRRKASPWPKPTLPLRYGHPPGYRRKPIHEVDEVLFKCDWLAWEAMKPNTS